MEQTDGIQQNDEGCGSAVRMEEQMHNSKTSWFREQKKEEACKDSARMLTHSCCVRIFFVKLVRGRFLKVGAPKDQCPAQNTTVTAKNLE
jgi:hypothetical protein